MADAFGEFSELLKGDVAVRPVSDGIWSVLPAHSPGQHYDRRAKLYDRVVGNRIYNRLFWGSSPSRYTTYARRAVHSATGPILDAGCGSLVFTAKAYAETVRPLILVDQSIGMLEAARDRLIRRVGALPDHVFLLQADLQSLPFRDGAFPTVLCMGMLHLFDDCAPVLREIRRVARPHAELFFASLVSDRLLGRAYLRILNRAGEVAIPRRESARNDALTSEFGEPVDHFREGNMGFLIARK